MPFDSIAFPETIAQKMLHNFGPNGEKWCRGHLYDGKGRACLMGQLLIATGVRDSRIRLHPAFKHLTIAIGGSGGAGGSALIVQTNDNRKTNFEIIRNILLKMHELEIKEMVDAVR